MGKIKEAYRKIKGKIKKTELEQELDNKSVNYLLRDRFQEFLDLLYKKDIDRYPDVKKLVRDFTELSSALIHQKRDLILDYLFERIFPAFLFKMIDESLHSGLSDPILELKKQITEIWEAYHLQQLEQLETSDTLGYLVSMDHLVQKKKPDELESDEEEEESKVQAKK